MTENRPEIRHDWTVDEALELFGLPFLDLAHRAQSVHRLSQPANRVQLCTLSNIKTGGCPEDCAYCPQAARYDTGVEAGRLLPLDTVLHQASCAAEHGATRFCMGAAWRQVRDNADFDAVLDMVRGVADLGLEVCATLGMVDGAQARQLEAAGLTAYNHNIDTSPEYYERVIGTRVFDDRMKTLEAVRQAGLRVCSGGIVGMGETLRDRAGMLMTLANLAAHPESVPINSLVAVDGTPLEDVDPIDSFDFLRTIAVARLMMPASRIRLAAGRSSLSREGQAMAFMCGANSIFYGDRLLTTTNPEWSADQALFKTLGIEPLAARPRRPAAQKSACEPQPNA
jgi:biotin synthase